MFYTYIHCRPSGEPFYVGKGANGRSHEFKNSRTLRYRRVISKYGKDAIGVFVFPCDSEQQAFADEKQHIAQLREQGCRLVNVCDGGEGPTGRKASPETRARISAAQVGRKWKPQSIAKRSATVTGSKRPEAGKKISAALLGRIFSPEHRAKLAEAARNISDEARLALSLAMLGTKLSDETRARMSIAQKRRRLEGR